MACATYILEFKHAKLTELIKRLVRNLNLCICQPARRARCAQAACLNIQAKEGHLAASE